MSIGLMDELIRTNMDWLVELHSHQAVILVFEALFLMPYHLLSS